MDENVERLYTVKEAAAALGVYPSTVRRWLVRDRLPYLQHAEGGLILIRHRDLFRVQRRSERDELA